MQISAKKIREFPEFPQKIPLSRPMTPAPPHGWLSKSEAQALIAAC